MRLRNLLLLAVMLVGLTHAPLSLGQDVNGRPSDEILSDDKPADSSKPSDKFIRAAKPTDRNSSIYYKNKLEFSLETGWLPINIPFVFDCFLGDAYNVPTHGPQYTLVPSVASLRWQMGNARGPWILRGNWDLTLSGAFTAIPRGPETHYGAYGMGIRRNFVRRNWRVAPYFEYRLGLGRIDARGPLGVYGAQGQDFTFTMMMGSGVRYNFNRTYSIEAGATWMHISNLYLSEPKYLNYGINVYGPIIGLNVRLAKPSGESAHH
jgi:lipid A 3-O-deacylase PagL